MRLKLLRMTLRFWKGEMVFFDDGTRIQACSRIPFRRCYQIVKRGYEGRILRDEWD